MSHQHQPFPKEQNQEEEHKTITHDNNNSINNNKTPFESEYHAYLSYLRSQILMSHLQARAKDLEFLTKSLNLFELPAIPLKKLRELLSLSGIPDICRRIRPFFWRILLDLLPTASESSVSSSLQAYKSQYEGYLRECFPEKSRAVSNKLPENSTKPLENQVMFRECRDHPLNTSKESAWSGFFKDQALWDEIEKDTRRTRKELASLLRKTPSFSDNYPDFSKQKEENTGELTVLTRILYVFAKKHKEIGYVQGMHEILAVVLFCFVNEEKDANLKEMAEIDGFFAFSQIMKRISRNFAPQDRENAIVAKSLLTVATLLRKIDAKLDEHLRKHAALPQIFAFQWVLLLFSREFPVDNVLKLWDSALCNEDLPRFVEFLCVAAVILLREPVLKGGNFAEIAEALQGVGLLDVEKLVEKARSLEIEWGK